jgi:hypothetical protein
MNPKGTAFYEADYHHHFLISIRLSPPWRYPPVMLQSLFFCFVSESNEANLQGTVPRITHKAYFHVLLIRVIFI